MYFNYKVLLGLVILICQSVQFSEAKLLEGLYCGTENCYDVLNVTRQSTKSEISKNYRQLARKYHPDSHRGEDNKKEAEVIFKIVANAYEILKDEEARNDYDYMLDNPDAYYAHYYRYYRRKGTKVDVRIVLFVTISIISIIQHFNSKQKYETAIKYFMTVPKYRNKALEMAAQEKAKIVSKKGKNKLSKAEQKEEMDKLIRKVIEENMDIQGAYAKPDIYDILWIQILICPYTLAKYMKWYFSWIYNFTILKKEYGDEEKLYLIRKMMKMGKNQFNAIEEDLKQEYLELELWEKENYEEWKLEEEEQKKIDMAGNSRHKQYRRYMKNHGPGRMTFED